MPSTYSDNLRIELIAAGEQAGTWDITTNRNLGTIIEQAIVGVGNFNVTTGDRTLLALNASEDEARNAVLVFSGTPTASVTVTVPAVDKEYTVRNNTTRDVVISPESGSGTYTCPPSSLSMMFVNAEDGNRVTGVSFTDTMASVMRNGSFPDALEAMGSASLLSPTFTGEPRAPTALRGDSSTLLATTEFVNINGVPRGAIILWSGSAASIPAGYALCNGGNGTPNLLNRFVVCAGNTYAVGATGGSPHAVLVSHNHGGTTGNQSHNHTHSGATSNAGNHTHNVTTRRAADNPTWQSAVGGGIGAGWTDLGARTATGQVVAAGAHTHSFTTGANSANHYHGISTQGVSATNANMPPYYALCYIMKL